MRRSGIPTQPLLRARRLASIKSQVDQRLLKPVKSPRCRVVTPARCRGNLPATHFKCSLTSEAKTSRLSELSHKPLSMIELKAKALRMSCKRCKSKRFVLRASSYKNLAICWSKMLNSDEMGSSCMHNGGSEASRLGLLTTNDDRPAHVSGKLKISEKSSRA